MSKVKPRGNVVGMTRRQYAARCWCAGFATFGVTYMIADALAFALAKGIA